MKSNIGDLGLAAASRLGGAHAASDAKKANLGSPLFLG
jgi:hypothetical protein